MQDAWSLSNHLDKLVLSSNRLLEPHPLIAMLDRLDDGLLLVLKLQWHQGRLTLTESFDKDRACMEEPYIYFLLVLVLLIEQGLFEIL